MRIKIYQMLVNKHYGICQRYHKAHDNAGKFGAFLSWIYLLLLNFAYYFLFFRFLDGDTYMEVYEEKRLKMQKPESCKEKAPVDLAAQLSKYDVISFDIFDTLIYRPFSSPTDLFYLIGIELECMDFARIRCESEYEARQIKLANEKHTEVTLDDIWNVVESKTGIKAELGKKTEIKYEKKFCYANEYMLEVYKHLKKQNKKIIFTTDMYLPMEVIEDILTSNGYEKEGFYLSCELKKSKCVGDVYTYIKSQMGKDLSYIHIGDNRISDVNRAKRGGFDTYPINNPNINAVLFRSNDMSPVIGGAYRGVVNNRLYNGMHQYSRCFEFGFIYGGLFVLGYCVFIHKYCKSANINKIFFLARDGEIIKKVYNILYPDEETEYIYFSRIAACKLSAEYEKSDYLKKMVYHKVNKGYTFEQLLVSMELEELLSTSAGEINPDDKLTSHNSSVFTDFLEKKWETILKIYQPQREAAKKYFSQYVKNGDRIAAVDIGWAGSGAVSLRDLIRREWKYDAEVFGIVAGTNTLHNAEPYMSEGFLLSEKMVSYMYSSSDNRDVWKKHNCSRDHNLYFELLVSSESASFLGFYPEENGDSYQLKFLEKEKNSEKISQIQDGVLKFAEDYLSFFGDYPFMFNISGRDAYAPMLLAMSYDERYLKSVYKDFELKVDVGK